MVSMKFKPGKHINYQGTGQVGSLDDVDKISPIVLKLIVYGAVALGAYVVWQKVLKPRLASTTTKNTSGGWY